MRLFTLNLLLVFLIPCYASDFREGEIITWNNDTIKGFIDYGSSTSNYKICRFKRNINEQEIKYYPSQLKAYKFIQGKYYISSINYKYNFKDTVFLEFLLKGRIDVCAFQDNGTFYFFLSKDTLSVLFSAVKEEIIKDGIKYVRDSEKYKGMLAFITNDEPTLRSNALNTKLNVSNIVSFAKKYHEKPVKMVNHVLNLKRKI